MMVAAPLLLFLLSINLPFYMRGLFCCGDLLNMYMRSSMYGIYEEYWNMETNLRVKRTGTRTEEKNDYNKHRIDSMKQTESRKNAGN